MVVCLVLDWILGFGCRLVWLCGLFCFVVRSALVGLICACLSLVVSFCYVLVLVYCGGLRCLGCDLLVWVCVLVLSGGSCSVCVGWWSAGFVWLIWFRCVGWRVLDGLRRFLAVDFALWLCVWF